MDPAFLNLLVVVALAVCGLAITALNYPFDADPAADDLLRAAPHFVKTAIQSAAPVMRPVQALLASLRRVDRTLSGSVERHVGREGRAGSSGAPDRDALRLPKRIGIDPALLGHSGFERASGPGKASLSTVFGSGGFDDGLREALGHLTGPRLDDASGSNGLGRVGDGPGGGGAGFTIGLDRISVPRPFAGLPGRGGNVADLGPKDTPRILSEPEGGVVIVDGFDRDLIRQVVHAHRAQVRYCYERELQRVPSLAGKVGVRFVISPDGTVRSAQVDDSTLNNATVERCLLSRVASWTFPKPKAGGVVIVTYPFVFRAAGN